MTQQYLKHRSQKAAGDVLDVADWNLGADSASSAHVGGTGRAVNFLVAASNAAQYVRNQADLAADGTDDQLDIQAAIDAL